MGESEEWDRGGGGGRERAVVKGEDKRGRGEEGMWVWGAEDGGCESKVMKDGIVGDHCICERADWREGLRK